MISCRALAVALLLVIPATIQAQTATIFQLANGKFVGIAYLPTGPVVLTDVTVLTVPVNPPGPPVTAGKRDVAILHETGLVTAKQASLHTYLQTNPAVVDWTKSKGHRLFILDPDGKDKDGRPSPVTQRFVKSLPAGTKLPALVILDQSSDAVYFAGELPADATGQGVVDLVKKHGG